MNEGVSNPEIFVNRNSRLPASPRGSVDARAARRVEIETSEDIKDSYFASGGKSFKNKYAAATS